LPELIYTRQRRRAAANIGATPMAATSQSLLSPAPSSLPRARLAFSAHRAVSLRRRPAFPAVAAASTSMATSEGEEKKETKLWGGRFEEGVTDAVERFTESISYDWQLYKYDIMGSKAHASMLAAQVPYVRSTMVVLGPSELFDQLV
jgi:argininosuccinate lyase